MKLPMIGFYIVILKPQGQILFHYVIYIFYVQYLGPVSNSQQLWFKRKKFSGRNFSNLIHTVLLKIIWIVLVDGLISLSLPIWAHSSAMLLCKIEKLGAFRFRIVKQE